MPRWSWASYWDHFKETEDPGLKLAVFSTGPAIRNYPLNLFTEIVGTFVLVFGVLAMAVANKAGAGFIAGGRRLIVGLLVFSIGLSLGGPTGYAINPARDLGPRIAHAILPVPGKGPSDWALLVGAGDRAAHRRRAGRGPVPLVVRALGGAMKKLINSPDDVVRDALRGMEAAHGDRVRISYDPYVVVRADAPVQGKVGIISGGGSGHEPMHGGFVGPGMLDAACPGEVFTSPTPDQMLEATKAVNGGAGVLHVVKNYTGDVMNFDMAADMGKGEDIEVETVLTNDDVAVEDSLYTAGRRGVGVTVLVEKICGGAAEDGRSLAEVAELGRRVNANGRSMGMALTPCITPGSGEPSFELADDEVEIGIGIHGEPGRFRESIGPASQIAERLMTPIVEDLPFSSGDKVLAFVNGMGGTPLIELYVVYAEVAKLAQEHGLSIERNLIGNYITSLEMQGCSITLVKLDDEMTRYWDAPVDTPGLALGLVETVAITRDGVVDWMRRFAGEMGEHRQELVRLDTAIGDGDHGTNMDRGMRKAMEKLDSAEQADPGAVLKTVAMALVSSVGGAAGPLYGTLFLQMGTAMAGQEEVDLAGWTEAWRKGLEGVQSRGKAVREDKTMVDALIPAIEALEQASDLDDGSARGRRRGRGGHAGDDPARRPQGPRELSRRAQQGPPGSRRDIHLLPLQERR